MVALKSIPSAGVGMFVYEKTKTYIKNYTFSHSK
jgi:hypothetical protein